MYRRLVCVIVFRVDHLGFSEMLYQTAVECLRTRSEMSGGFRIYLPVVGVSLDSAQRKMMGITQLLCTEIFLSLSLIY